MREQMLIESRSAFNTAVIEVLVNLFIRMDKTHRKVPEEQIVQVMKDILICALYILYINVRAA